MDSITENGNYLITNATGNPYGNGSTAICEVTRGGTSILQIAHRNGEADKSRWKWSGTWTSWIDDMTAVLDVSSNIDNLRTPGIYQTTNGSYGAIAIVWKYDSQFIFQLSMDVNATDINPRVRMWVGNATTPYWTEWKKL